MIFHSNWSASLGKLGIRTFWQHHWMRPDQSGCWRPLCRFLRLSSPFKQLSSSRPSHSAVVKSPKIVPFVSKIIVKVLAWPSESWIQVRGTMMWIWHDEVTLRWGRKSATMDGSSHRTQFDIKDSIWMVLKVNPQIKFSSISSRDALSTALSETGWKIIVKISRAYWMTPIKRLIRRVRVIEIVRFCVNPRLPNLLVFECWAEHLISRHFEV
jgi:hypothetical protein